MRFKMQSGPNCPWHLAVEFSPAADRSIRLHFSTCGSAVAAPCRSCVPWGDGGNRTRDEGFADFSV